MNQQYHAYIMASHTRKLYTGVTSNLEQRVRQHKSKTFDGFTKKYNITRLVWYSEFEDINQAIETEKRIKGLLRKKKIALIEEINPLWADLAEEEFEDQPDKVAD
jgi:putative endonuclease